MGSGADDHYDNHIIVIAVLAGLVFVVGGIALGTAAENWGPDTFSAFDDTPIEPMPLALQYPWTTAIAAALNVLILGRAWVFFLRIEAITWWFAEDRRVQQARDERERIAAGNVGREVARRRQTCPNCSIAIPPEARFCDSCGYRVQPAPGG